jgi:Txe/YoeB family toxin of Txe-Axe toxin-antitoxin module
MIGVIYRPPNTDINLFLNEFNVILHKIKLENKIVYLTGDFNINLLNAASHLLTEEFLELMYSYSFLPLINRPTRVTNNTATLIDNIWVNEFNENLTNGIFYTDITDHFPIFTINCEFKIKAKVQFILKREYTNENKTNFANELSLIDWDRFSSTDAQLAFSRFYEKYKLLYDEHFPVKKCRLGYKTRKTWLTKGLLNSIKYKNYLFMRSRKFPCEANIQKYKSYKNKLNKLLRISEREHYKRLFEKFKRNMRKTWGVLKDLIHKKRSKQCSSFVINNNTSTDVNSISNHFNQYFINVGFNLAKSIPNTNVSHRSYLKTNSVNSILLTEVNKKELENTILQLKECSPGYDGITAKIFKESYQYCLDPLLKITNLVLIQGIFPHELKIASVTPIFKNKDPSLFSNYRPVSVLPLLSKIFEKLTYNRILSFLNDNNILYKLQFGFRNNYNTSLALIYLVDKIKMALDEGKFVLGLFIDLSKAFDTVNHAILLDKMYNYGIRGNAYNLINSYLSERRQFVCFENSKSECLKINCGVPQGSILGPLLFLIYINDLPNVSEKIFSVLFADDTNFFIDGKDINKLVSVMNNEINKVINWMRSNKLSLNIDKTKYVIFKTPNKRCNVTNDITVNNQVIDRVESIKFLGVVLDENLKWTDHIKLIKSKISKNIGIICKARKKFEAKALMMLYNSLILPYLNYCIEVWGHASITSLNSIFKLQKRILRIIKSVNRRTESKPLFIFFKVLNVFQLLNYTTIIFMYKFEKKMLPMIFEDMFKYNFEVHNYNTRRNNNLATNFFKLSGSQHSMKHYGAKLFNFIRNKVNINFSIHTFKRKLKHFILNNEIIIG